MKRQYDNGFKEKQVAHNDDYDKTLQGEEIHRMTFVIHLSLLGSQLHNFNPPSLRHLCTTKGHDSPSADLSACAMLSSIILVTLLAFFWSYNDISSSTSSKLRVSTSSGMSRFWASRYSYKPIKSFNPVLCSIAFKLPSKSEVKILSIMSGCGTGLVQ